MYFGPHNVGPFLEQMGVSANQPKMDQFLIFLVGPGPRSKKTVICKTFSAIWQGIGLKI